MREKQKRLSGFLLVFFMSLVLLGLNVQAAETESSAISERQTTEAFSTDTLVYGDSTGITRGQWLHDLAVMFDMSVDEDDMPDEYFSDLDSSYEYYGDIMLNIAYGVIDIEAGEKVEPEKLVTRDFAAQTLNHLLGFQPADSEYSFSDASECSNPDSAQIAVNRGWFSLVSGKFLPEQTITGSEIEAMVGDTQMVLSLDIVDDNYENTYTFAAGVIEVPEGTEVTADENNHVTISDCPVDISEGDNFAVYLNGVAVVYHAESVASSGADRIITATQVEDEEAFIAYDAQGTIYPDISLIEPAEGATIIYVDNTTDEVYTTARAAKAAYGRNVLKKATIEIKREYDCGGGAKLSFKIKLKNPTLEYNLMSNGEVASAKLKADVEVSYGVKGDLAETFGINKLYIMSWGIPGVGGLDVFVDTEISGSLTGTYKGNLICGFGYYGGTDIRFPFQYTDKGYSVSAEATGAVGLQAQFGITQLPALKAYVYGKAGAKAVLKSTTYDDGAAPKRCTEFKAYLYASYGASGSIKIGSYSKKVGIDVPIIDENSSPVRILKHYDDGVLVTSCGRGTKIGYLTSGSSRWLLSGWSRGIGYGYDSEGVPVNPFTYTLDDDGNATITKYTGSMSCLVIPEQIDGHTVVAIGYDAFRNNQTLAIVIIPDTVESIGYRAFESCASLEEVIIPDSVTDIGCAAFGKCSSLYSIQLPAGLISLGSSAFYDCDSLTKINIPAHIEEIPSTQTYDYPWMTNGKVFAKCDNLKTISFDEGITYIPRIMNSCDSIEEIAIPDTVTIIGYSAFESCTLLQKVYIPESVSEIGSAAFGNCINLGEVSLPLGLKKLGSSAFYNCASLTEIRIPAHIEEVPSTQTYDSPSMTNGKVFAKCDNLKTVIFEEGITSIPRIMNGCNAIERVEIPDTATEIEYGAFESCESLQTVIIPESVTAIGSAAFGNCLKLEEIELPSKLKSLGSSAFYNCDSLTEIQIPATIENVPSTQTYDYPSMTYGKVFAKCDNLERIIYENGITRTFSIVQSCTSVKEVILPDTITVIDDSAFANCTSLENIVLPSALTRIGNYAFSNTSLSQIVVPDSVVNMGSHTFEQCKQLLEVTLPNSQVNIMESMFEGCTTLESIDLPDTITTINNNAFKDCNKLKQINWSKSIVTLRNNVFQNCSSLEKVEFPKTVKEIGNNAFQNCDLLTEVVISDSVVSLGTSVFYDCDALTTVTLGTGLTSIPSSTFEHCDLLESIVLPYRIRSIGSKAFKDCVKFTSITIPRATTEIDATAFSYPAKMTVYGISGTYAETFADEQGMTFVNREVKATEASLSKTEITINSGSKETLVLAVTPSDFTDEVSWKCTDTNVVTVDDSGLVTAKSVGEAVIKVTVGDLSASCKVVVVQPVTSIYLNQSSLTLEALDTCQLTASVYPSDAENQEVAWSSSDEQVAVVTQDGLVTALGKGKATITAAAQDGSGVSRSCTVTVNNTAHEAADVEELESPHNYGNNCSDFWVYSVDGAVNLNVTFDSNTNVEEDFDFLYIYDGEGNQIGKYTGTELAGKTVRVPGSTVRIKLVSDDAGNAWGFKVTDVQAVMGPEKQEQAIKGTKEYQKETGDAPFKLDAALEAGDGEFSYTSDNPVAAEVSADGTVTVKGIGTAVITVTAAETELYKAASFQVTIVVSKKATDNPPVDNPPVDNPPADNPPADNSPTDNPPVSKPPVNSPAPRAVGTVLTIQGSTFRVTEAQGTSPAVAFCSVTDKNETAVTIPKTIQSNGVTYQVTSIDKNAFANLKKLKTAVISAEVTEIGANAFKGCAKLTKVTLPSSLQTIGTGAFTKCISLKKVVIGKSVSKIGAKAFYGCKTLKSITIKSTKLKSVGKSAIGGIPKKAVIKVPKKKLKAYKKLFKKSTGYKSSMKIK